MKMTNKISSPILMRTMVATVVLCLVLAAGSFSKASAETPTFSNGSLDGSYGFLDTRSPSSKNTSPSSVVGVFTFDGVSAVTGSYVSNDNGKIQSGTLTGSYSINSDGTGSMKIKPSGNGNGTLTFSVVLNAAGNSFQFLETGTSKGAPDVEGGIAIHQ